MDPLSHGFHVILNSIDLKDGLFAVKTLRQSNQSNKTTFDNESAQLRRFSGFVHDHLVTLLGTYSLSGRYNFIFPYAEYALDDYWQIKSTPHWELETIRWVVKQCSGITAAVDTIHDPKHLHGNLLLQSEQGYGRHGDIKPDNILWFNSTNDSRGILVVSDLGLTAFHRQTKCEVDGGTVSRAFDIWTLGCLFLEMLTWLLGGKEALDEFDEKRTTEYLITGSRNNIFFCVEKEKDSEVYVARVKDEVTRWVDDMHDDKNCSQFIHDTLDIIEKEMLVVLSKEPEKKRSSSGVLRKKFQDLHTKCQNTNNSDYFTKGKPIRRIFQAQTAVEANLNSNAQDTLAKNSSGPIAGTFVGKRSKALSPREMKDIDRKKSVEGDGDDE